MRVFDQFGGTTDGEATYSTSMSEAAVAEVVDARVASGNVLEELDHRY